MLSIGSMLLYSYWFARRSDDCGADDAKFSRGERPMRDYWASLSVLVAAYGRKSKIRSKKTIRLY